jgi:hypothetical protein
VIDRAAGGRAGVDPAAEAGHGVRLAQAELIDVLEQADGEHLGHGGSIGA